MDRCQTVLLTDLDAGDISRIIEMAWEDRTPFEAIASQFGLRQTDVMVLMRQQLSPSSFIAWRKRTRGQHTKHLALRRKAVSRHCSHAQHKQYRP